MIENYNKNTVSLDKILMRYEINFPDVWFSQKKKLQRQEEMLQSVYDVRHKMNFEKCVSLWGFMVRKWSESEEEFTRDVKSFLVDEHGLYES